MRHHGHMKSRPTLLVVCLVSLSLLPVSLVSAQSAQMEMNVDQLAQFLRSELALKQHTDKQIAAYVKKMKLSEKLPDKTILDLEAQGAGPKTVTALQELRDQTAAMKAPGHDATYSPGTVPDNPVSTAQPSMKLGSKAPPIPAPDSVRQQQILEQIKQYALNYTQNLPNFVCVEVIRRFVDPNTQDNYRSLGDVLAKVSYNQGQEKYEVYSVNGHIAESSLDKVAATGGAISSGEFGSMMSEVFQEKSQAQFGWDHWATLRGRRVAVFNYYISSGHSNYSISYSGSPGDEQRIITAYKGLIYADENTGEVARIRFEAVDIPASFPVRQASETLDYDLVEINGQKYICPLSARLFMTSGRDRTKNELDFHNYRKFGTESSIVYDTNPTAPPPAPLPASKTDEQPAVAGDPGTSKAPAAKPQTPPKSAPWTLPTAPPPPPPQ